MRLLSLSGSLRAASSNTHTLIAAGLLTPPGVVIEHYDAIGELPHFTPDLDANLPQSIVDLRSRVGKADGLLIACPEYARGIPGSFKNMLDWLVGSPDFPGKPIVLFNTSPRASAAQAALKLCSGLMYPDTDLGEIARHREVFDEQAKSYVFP